MTMTDRLRTLASFRGVPAVTSLYLDVDGRHRPRAVDVARAFDGLARRAREEAGSPEALRSVEGDLERFATWLETDLDRSRVRGVALFGCSAAGMFTVVELQRPVDDGVSVDEVAHLRRLEEAADTGRHYAVMLVDRHHARFLAYVGGEMVEHGDLADTATVGDDERTREAPWRARRGAAAARRHFAYVASLVAEQLRAEPVDALVVGGPDADVAALLEALRPLAGPVPVERVAVRVGAPVEEVRRALVAAEARLRAARTAGVVSRLVDATDAEHAVGGLDAVLDAVSDGRASTLVVESGWAAQGARCVACGRLASHGGACPGCGRPMLHAADVVEEAVHRAIAAGCDVEVVPSGSLEAAGRVGVLLRY